MKPYYTDDTVTLYCGDMRDVLPDLGQQADCIVTDPPYGETSLTWDRWPHGWPAVAASAAKSMWCFGSMRMFLDRRDDFGLWRMSQDLVWEKHNGTGFATDRFKRVHEHATHWYLGNWAAAHHEVPRVPRTGPDKSGARRARVPHTGEIASGAYIDDGTRLMRSVVRAPSVRGSAIHPTEKPVGILVPLIEYACPLGGIVLDPFAGSGSTATAARLTGRKAILAEANERYCEAIANRLAQDVLPLGVAS